MNEEGERTMNCPGLRDDLDGFGHDYEGVDVNGAPRQHPPRRRWDHGDDDIGGGVDVDLRPEPVQSPFGPHELYGQHDGPFGLF